MAIVIYIAMLAGLLNSLVESKRNPLKRKKATAKPANFEQKQIEYRRGEREDLNKIHSIAWDVKTRAVEEIQYTEI